MNDDELLLVACPACHALNRLPQQRLDQNPNCGRCRQPVFAGQAFALDAASFDTHALRSELPLLVDFWAPWCGPCRTMAPAFAEAAARLEPWVHLAKVDTEAYPELGQRFAVRSIPTLVLFHQGRELARHSGLLAMGGIVQFTQAALREHFA